MIPDDPAERDFHGLQKGTNGFLPDDELVHILADSIKDHAGMENQFPRAGSVTPISSVQTL